MIRKKLEEDEKGHLFNTMEQEREIKGIWIGKKKRGNKTIFVGR